MDELMRRRMLWIALVGSAGFFLVTLLLAATGNLTSGWYLIGAAVYGALFVLAVVGFLTEKVQDPRVLQVMPVMAAETRANGHGNGHQGREVRERIEERVIYTTPRGQVVEAARSGPQGTVRDFDIETEGEVEGLTTVERRVDARRLPAGEAPSDEELHAGLRRWGRIREVA